ncbi:MAG: FtsX-like permease family protein [Balneolaceae bacterium]|nr:FtsX-like permease family protein [Balneolaceae bacterium]
MLKNYFKVAIRHLSRNKSYTIINTMGLGIGLAACIIIGLWVNYQLSYDDYHQHADRIYRVLSGESAATPPTLAPVLKSDHPGLANEVVRFWPVKAPSDIVYKNKKFAERAITFSDPSVFEVFSHPLVHGNKETALTNPTSIAISEKAAKKYFGDELPLGKTMNMWGTDLEVTAVFKDVPQNSHHRYDFLVPVQLLKTFMGNMMENWTWAGFYTYMLAPENTDINRAEAVITNLLDKYSGEEFPPTQLQPLNEVYFNPAENDIAVSGNLSYVIILATIAIVVLLVACINFMNLSTAYASLRKKEVGLRKTLGAYRKQLVGQFLGEAMLLTVMGLSLATLLVELSLPFFQNFTNTPLQIPYDQIFGIVGSFIGLTLLIGTAAGSYPAFFLARFKPVNSLKGNRTSSSSGGILRKSLVVTQFVASTFLIISALTIYQQLDFMQNKNLGFDDEKVMITEAGDYLPLKEELEKLPFIESVSASQSVPGQRFPFYPFKTPDMAPDSLPVMRTLRVNPGFIETLGIEVMAGRSFDEKISTDKTNAFLLNKAAADHLGWEDAVGKELSWYNFSEDGTDFTVAKQGEVIGVVDNFNYASLHSPVEPLIIHVGEGINLALIRLQTNHPGEAVAAIRSTWNEVSPGRPFWYYFLGDELDRQYGAEQKLGQVIAGLTMLALFIACLGLFGLNAFTARQRTKEIGIRKVLGASVQHIILLLNKDVLKMVIISMAIAVPVGFYAMNSWLAEFAYKIELSTELFVIAGLASLVLALITVSFQSIKAALMNPVNSIRDH